MCKDETISVGVCVCVSKPLSEGTGVACALLTMPTLTCTRSPKINVKIHNREDSLAVALELLARFKGNQRFQRNENVTGLQRQAFTNASVSPSVHNTRAACIVIFNRLLVFRRGSGNGIGFNHTQFNWIKLGMSNEKNSFRFFLVCNFKKKKCIFIYSV